MDPTVDTGAGAASGVLAELVAFTEELLIQAVQVEEICAERLEDARQARLGRVRVACQWCDGEFHVDAARATEPVSCHTCALGIDR